MEKCCLVLLIAFSIAISGCSSSATSGESPDDPPKPPPSVGKEAPYRGGFTKEMRISDARTIISIFERNYAPREWKEKSLGLSFEKLSRDFLESAEKEMPDESFYGLIAQYLSAFQDSHISFHFPSSARASLPISTDYLDGKVVVIDTDTPKVALGSELVSIDGKSSEKILKNNLSYIGQGNPEAALRFAAARITFISQAKFPKLPQNAVSTLVFKKPTFGETYEVNLEWSYRGSEFAEFNDPGIDIFSSVKSQTGFEKSNPLFDRTQRLFSGSRDYAHLSMGEEKPFFPVGENFILRKASPHYTGVFLIDGKRIAYLRIHDFNGGTYDFKDAIAQLEEDIPYYEETTDAIIIDQTGNPGGSWHYSTTIASFFFDRPFEDLKDAWKANRATLSWVEDVVEYYRDSDNSEKAKWFKILAEEVRQAMKDGRILTKALPIINTSGTIEPYKTKDGTQITYTKPMLLLMNELSVSCGDLFPALMKDNGRATLFGTRTMGGGGAVHQTSPIGYSEIAIGHTVSLTERNAETEFDGKKTNLLENVGVAPDIEYRIGLDDLMSGYELYREHAIEAALGLLENQTQDEQEDEPEEEKI